MSSRFDLVICMVGSAACNPVLQALLATHWDERFFFSEWDEDLMAKLLAQLDDRKVGDVVVLSVERAGKSREVRVELQPGN